MGKKSLIILAVLAGFVAISLVIFAMMNRNSTSNDANQSQSPQASSESSSESAAENQTNKVAIKDSDYSPTKIVVKKGTTVTWTNDDAMGHNVVASDSSRTGGLPMNSPLLEKGETFSHTFNEVGVFPYTCTPHPFMRGAVEVTE